MAGLAGGLAPAGKQAFWFVGLSLTGLAAHIGARQAIRQNLLFLRVGFAFFRGFGSAILLLLFGLLFYLLIPLLMLGVVYLLGNGLGLSAGQSQILFITLILGLATALYLDATKP